MRDDPQMSSTESFSSVAVVLPVGPTCSVEFVADTIQSIDYFLPGRKLVICDDSGDKSIALQALNGGEATILTLGGYGLRGGLYRSLCEGMSAALNTAPSIILRLDTDGLVASNKFVTQAIARFEGDPRLGALGSYRLTYSGTRRSFSKSGLRLLAEATGLGFAHPRRAITLAGLTLRALTHGYALGEHIMGGATVYRGSAVARLLEKGLLDERSLWRSGLQEDHLFGLLLRSLGFTLGDFGTVTDDGPMGVKWKGLPASPEELITQGKSLIHSTKYYNGIREADIRSRFAAAREGCSSAP